MNKYAVLGAKAIPAANAMIQSKCGIRGGFGCSTTTMETNVPSFFSR